MFLLINTESHFQHC